MGLDLYQSVKRGVVRERGRLRELAEASGVSYSWLTKMSAGRFAEVNVGMKTLQRVAAGLAKLRGRKR